MNQRYVNIFIFLLISFVYLPALLCDTIGGIPPEEWSSKCRKHFKKHGDLASDIPIYNSGFCEKYRCQKYGNDMYGVTTQECKKITSTKSGCRVVEGNKEKQYPFCCPKLKCERRNVEHQRSYY